MKVIARHPIDFTPDMHIARIYQAKMTDELNLPDVDIIDIMIMYYLKTLKLFTEIQENDIFFIADDEEGHLYYSVHYSEFTDVCPLARISKDEFYERLDKLQKLNLVTYICDMFNCYYKCTALTDEFMEIL